MLRVIASALIASIVLAGQDPALKKLVDQAQRIRQAEAPDSFQATPAFKVELRDWVETRLPPSHAALQRGFPRLQSTLTAELAGAGLFRPRNVFWKNGYVERLEISRPPADPNRLIVVAGVTDGCGFNDSAYVYDYSRGARSRVAELNSTRDHDESILGIHASAAGAEGSRLLLTLRYAAQCGSSWNVLAYDLYRLTGTSVKAIFAGEHDIWFGGGDPNVRLSSDDLRIELRDRSIDAGVHSRTHVLHYKVGPNAVERVDPVALQPRDFVEEWLTRPWTEMESRTAVSARERLKKSHDLLQTDFVAGDYVSYQPCAPHEDRCQIAIEMRDGVFYFLVRALGQQRFEMMDVSSTKQP